MIAVKFSDDVSTVRELAVNGNFGSAKEAFGKFENRCAECHTKFRD
ncbi:cytochrome c [Oryzomonas japonica]|uniref:Cytochrome c n=1 Tax=Oryzomonas japonica TaxID=2603858 RepID=A0A7J4ZMQ6_9BACT|nr:cytochrome c [Oryzomonas japonica]